VVCLGPLFLLGGNEKWFLCTCLSQLYQWSLSSYLYYLQFYIKLWMYLTPVLYFCFIYNRASYISYSHLTKLCNSFLNQYRTYFSWFGDTQFFMISQNATICTHMHILTGISNVFWFHSSVSPFINPTILISWLCKCRCVSGAALRCRMAFCRNLATFQSICFVWPISEKLWDFLG
jgi:hypothetical protein